MLRSSGGSSSMTSRRSFKDGSVNNGMFQRVKDKPQGFEIGKLRRKGFYQCPYGCEKLFRLEREAMRLHMCPARQETFRKVVEMYLRENLVPPQMAIDESNGIMHNNDSDDEDSSMMDNFMACKDERYDRDVSNSSDSSTASSYNEIVRGLPRSVNKEEMLIDWITSSDFNKKAKNSLGNFASK